ncbi:YggT family protein [bacterium]|nr:YggT family protein [bacterium]
MARFIIFLDRLVNYYLYFIVMACFLSLVPNINPDYPLFNFIFKAAGFYIIPTIFGFIISPVLIMISLALISSGLHKIYYKYYAKDEPQIIVMSPEEFIKKVQEENVESNIQSSLEEKENKKDDSE